MSKNPHTRKYFILYYDDQEFEGTFDEIQELTGIHRKTLWVMMQGYHKDAYGEEVGTSYPIYDFYQVKEQRHLGTCTLPEMAELLGIKEKSLSNRNTYRKEFTGKYKIVEDEEMITRRTINKVAPVPVPEKYNGVAVKKQITVRPAAEKQFKVGEYAQYLHDAVFANWNLKEGQ